VRCAYHHPPTRTVHVSTQRVSPPTNAYRYPPAAVVDFAAALAAATTGSSAAATFPNSRFRGYNACGALGDAGAITAAAAAAAAALYDAAAAAACRQCDAVTKNAPGYSRLCETETETSMLECGCRRSRSRFTHLFCLLDTVLSMDLLPRPRP